MKNSFLQGFSAGVASIAATVMVLQLTIPSSGDVNGLLSQWHALLAHFNSFFLIYILWYSYSKEFGRVTLVDSGVVMINGLWLIFLALLPFATGWLEKFPSQTLPELFFAVIFTICLILDRATIASLMKQNPEAHFSERIGLKARIPIYVALGISFITAFLFPIANVFIMVGITIYMTVLMIKTRYQDISII